MPIFSQSNRFPPTPFLLLLSQFLLLCLRFSPLLSVGWARTFKSLRFNLSFIITFFLAGTFKIIYLISSSMVCFQPASIGTHIFDGFTFRTCRKAAAGQNQCNLCQILFRTKKSPCKGHCEKGFSQCPVICSLLGTWYISSGNVIYCCRNVIYALRHVKVSFQNY